MADWRVWTSSKGLRTEGVSDSGTSVQRHGGGWLVVEPTNSSLGVWLINNIFDLEDISGFGSLLLEGESDTSLLLDDTLGSSLGLSESTGSTSLITSEASSIGHLSNSGRGGSPVSNLTDEITLSTVDLRGGSTSSSWESKSESLVSGFLSKGSRPSGRTASTGNGVSWRSRSKTESESGVLPDNVLLVGKVDWRLDGELNGLTLGLELGLLASLTTTTGSDLDGVLLGESLTSIDGKKRNTSGSLSPDGHSSEKSVRGGWWNEVLEEQLNLVGIESGITESAESGSK